MELQLSKCEGIRADRQFIDLKCLPRITDKFNCLFKHEMLMCGLYRKPTIRRTKQLPKQSVVHAVVVRHPPPPPMLGCVSQEQCIGSFHSFIFEINKGDFIY